MGGKYSSGIGRLPENRDRGSPVCPGPSPRNKRAAGDDRPPPPRTFTRVARRTLLAAAFRAAASLLLCLHVGSRALLDAANAGATCALTATRLTATAAVTRSAADIQAAGGWHEGHEGQCRQENQTVHDRNPFQWNNESITPRHDMCTWESHRTCPPTPPDSRPRTGRHGSMADSGPPDSVEDPHWPDRNRE